MFKHDVRKIAAAGLAAFLALTACSWQDLVSRLQPAPALQASSLDEVMLATVQIEAEGTFVDPQVGLVQNAAGRGSGFIIDPSGLAVTNSHVVNGAALLKVWVGGAMTPLNARILGLSECSDLALIDIEGEGFHYLGWYQEPLSTGLDVYAAGFPLGDPEFTLNRGIVSKVQANGDTYWASVDSVLEHDAVINPGNSGGPLVTSDGLVVGVNYSSNQDARQSFAISQQLVNQLIGRLRNGENVESIGINGSAVSSSDGSLTGIWVSSVASGSAAERAGILPGDIITAMEDVVLAADGTMADYCDILRTHAPSDALAIQVLRYETQQILAGQLNGSPLQVAYSFGDALGGAVASSAAYSTYVQVSDESGAITIEVPAEWTSVSGLPWQEGDMIVGAAVSASTSLDAWRSGQAVPAVFVGITALPAASQGPIAWLDAHDYSSACTYEGRTDVSDSTVASAYDVYSACGPQQVALIQMATTPIDGGYLVVVQAQIVSDADLAALDHIIVSAILDPGRLLP